MRALARRLLPSAFALLAVPAALASESAPALEEPLPIPLDAYTGEAGMTLGQVLVHRVEEDPVNLVATVVFGAAAILRLRFGKEPIFPRRVLKEPLFQVAITCMILLSINAYGFFLLLPVFMQRLRGLTTLQAGLTPHWACSVPGSMRHTREVFNAPGKPFNSPM